MYTYEELQESAGSISRRVATYDEEQVKVAFRLVKRNLRFYAENYEGFDSYKFMQDCGFGEHNLLGAGWWF
jgi:hypothetical protein